jgi:hypothetical protein
MLNNERRPSRVNKRYPSRTGGTLRKSFPRFTGSTHTRAGKDPSRVPFGKPVPALLPRQDFLGIFVTDYLLVYCTICLAVVWSISVVVQSSYWCLKQELEPLSQELEPHCTRTRSVCSWARNWCSYVRAPLAGLGAVLGALMQENEPHCTRPSLALLEILPKTSKIV